MEMNLKYSFKLLTSHFLLLTFTIFLLTSLTTKATVRYVSKTGLSIPPYTSWETAADSIQECINASFFGDTIYVANGVYKEKVVMIPGLALIGSDWDSTVIDTRGLLEPGYPSVWFKDSCYLSGFKIIVSDENLIGNGVYVNDGLKEVSGVISQNNIVRGLDGIFAGNSKTNIDKNKISLSEYGISIDDINNSFIKDNIIIKTGVGINIGIGANPKIFSNIIVLENNGSGIGATFSYGSIRKNNLILGISGKRGWDAFNNDIIINNVIYGSFSSEGVYSYGKDYSKNNSITAGSRGYVIHSYSTDIPVFQYNNVWGNNQDYVNFTPDSTNISVDPMYVNPDSQDFHLQMYSPLIDAGDPNIVDKDSSRSDIGLYGGPNGESYAYLDLSPRPPVNLSAVYDSTSIILNWNKNTEADFSHYLIYRDVNQNFIADSTKLIAETSDTSYVDMISSETDKLFYKLRAVDNQGNQSAPSEEIFINLTSVTTNDLMTINDYRLYQNYPNPFNPSTVIPFRLKEKSYAKLRVYNINGELVSVLVNKVMEAGYHEVTFEVNKTDEETDKITKIASGIYLYKLDVINDRNIPFYSEVKKMLFIK
jgi:hypothetical protein